MRYSHQLQLFGISELLTIFKMEIVGQLLQILQQLKKNRDFRFSMKQEKELVGNSDRLLFLNSLDDGCNFCNGHGCQLFPFWKELSLYLIKCTQKAILPLRFAFGDRRLDSF